jgi:hypothetical protein
MRFLILRKADAQTEAGAMPDQALIEVMGRYNQALVDAGVMRAGDGLKPSVQGVRLTIAPGACSIVDGPFTEAKELVAGLSVFECASKQEALDWLLRWPPEDGGGNVALELRVAGCPGGCAEVVAATGGARAGAAESAWGQRYAVLLRSNALTETDAAPPRAVLDTLDAFNAAQARAGVLLAADGLHASAHGARVRFAAGVPSVVDGPFTEIKELIAGYWMIRAASMDAAIAWARTVPYPIGAQVEVEIRPLYEIDDFDIAFDADLRLAEARMREQQLDAGMRAALAGTAQA